ncbi:uncharacterized protein LOC130719603 [Lotus japonicus]|uniref:uncharacterized protein LOC130719603 n=1 Tax=Lotus japonicus TaxID=34305 RepID=UPI00258885E4|nr:uncharacterized protein LOC130719603 [Lotus japonicus]
MASIVDKTTDFEFITIFVPTDFEMLSAGRDFTDPGFEDFHLKMSGNDNAESSNIGDLFPQLLLLSYLVCKCVTVIGHSIVHNIRFPTVGCVCVYIYIYICSHYVKFILLTIEIDFLYFKGGESLPKVVNDNSPSKIGDTEAATLKKTKNKKVARSGCKPGKAKVRKNSTPELMSRVVCKEFNGARTLGTVFAYCSESKLYTVAFNNGAVEDMESNEVLKYDPVMEDFVPKEETTPSTSLKKTEATTKDATSEGSNPTRKRKNTYSG